MCFIRLVFKIVCAPEDVIHLDCFMDNTFKTQANPQSSHP